MPTTEDSVWTERDTTPAAIETALRRLLAERHAELPDSFPARVLNLVAIVDKEWSGEIANRLRGVGRYQPSRTIVCQVEPGRAHIDATVSVATREDASLSLARELVLISVGPHHLPHLETIVDPLVVTDLPTMVWSPHGYPDAVDALLRIAQIVLLDAVDDPDAADALAWAAALVDRAIVVDLAWLRSTPWRERLAALFDPPAMRLQLGRLRGITIREEPGSGAVGLLLLGWLASRLGWTVAPLDLDARGGRSGVARTAGDEIRLTLEPVPIGVRGLAGLSLDLADGTCFALDRGRGGLQAVRTGGGRPDARWTIMGASRGEGGILGEGIRQALLRDPIYPPALAAAKELVR